MNKKLLMVGTIILFLTIGLSGCTDEKSIFIGTWANGNGEITLTFSDDGTCSMYRYIVDDSESYAGEWEIDAGRLGLDWFGEILVFDYSFSDGDKTLKLFNTDDGSEFLVLTKL